MMVIFTDTVERLGTMYVNDEFDSTYSVFNNKYLQRNNVDFGIGVRVLTANDLKELHKSDDKVRWCHENFYNLQKPISDISFRYSKI